MTNKIIGTVEKKGELLEFNISNFNCYYEIFYSTNREFKNEILLSKESKEIVNIKCPDEENRLFFRIVDSSNEEIILSTRKVDIKSIDNFRDLGGYKTRDGKTVKWGYFYRCATLGNTNERDKKYLENMGIKTIFDFRSHIEVNDEADIVPEGAKYINESGIQEMDNAFKGNNNFDMKSLMMGMEATQEKMKEIINFLIGGYKNMAIQNGAFKKFFDAIKDKNRVPLVFHCTAGKDRTGVGGALILLALGVPEDKVIEDYCLSNFYRKEVNEMQLNMVRQFTKDEKILEVVNDLFCVKEDYIRVTLDCIKERYDSYEDYIINELGVSKEELNKLKEDYLY